MYRLWRYFLILSCVACGLIAAHVTHAGDSKSSITASQTTASVYSRQHAIDSHSSLQMAAEESSDTHAVDLFLPFHGYSVTIADGQTIFLVASNVISLSDQSLVARRIRLQI
jgi:uncharacterized cupredoxin-like copper-binding protein